MLKLYNYDIVCQEIPDEITLALNIACCPYHCDECHSPWLQEEKGEDMTFQKVFDVVGLYSTAVTCVCFMGGDADPEYVEKLSNMIRTAYPNLKTGWYSGRLEIPQGMDPKSFNFIKIGPYLKAFGGLKSETTNQRLYRVEDDGELVEIHVRR